MRGCPGTAGAVAAAAVEKAHFERVLLHCMVVFKYIVVTK